MAHNARSYLVGLGLAKPGRGKFSSAAKDALSKAMSEGITFTDWPKAGTVVKVPNGTTAKIVKAESAETSNYLTPDDYRYPEKEYRAVIFKNGKRVPVSLREACNTCRVSLVNHACESPTIHNDITVTIERKSN